ncbi:fluoride efflux transporter CrcB [Pseudonocardia broussonetiae]|uniref:Fluoride-specific ion channel FluC n=1 Tax=Pseudonocardia broussonetiae TaxID=2736640 RepID=A0A6M6JDR3_9PSEU|nr:fluoride efflux transporter CrcB [Pseudonocardia broussonetiae]QJY45253.1 fluoride efflux transporter CrcB [Pseudonocardia broussonetiae]
MTALLVVLGAAVGAPLRYAVDRVLQARHGAPWGTFAVNVAGSLVLGAVVGAAASAEVLALVGTGFCGALTTYSTFGWETLALGRDGRRAAAVLYAVGSVVAGLVAAGLGLALGAGLAG